MFSRIVSSLSSALDFNAATLSGCVDIIVVPDAEGRLCSTPFHLRFGKSKVLRSREKRILINVNGQDTPVTMVLGHAGEAYFVVPFDPEPRSWPNAEFSGPHLSPRPPPASPPASSPVNNRRAFAKRIQISLCGHLLIGLPTEAKHDRDVFQANLLDWDSFDADPNLWFHPHLVFTFDDSAVYLPARVALPIIASWAIYDQSIGKQSFTQLLQSRLKYRRSLLEPLKNHLRHSDSRLPEHFAAVPMPETSRDGDSSNGKPSMFRACCAFDQTPSEVNDSMLLNSCVSHHAIKVDDHTRISLKPTSEQLLAMNLKPGANSVTFTVDTPLQGACSVSGTIYLWPRDAKIVISDVDGTITKSDLVGQLAPIVGLDWSQKGVAELFTNIVKRKYRIIYLTARAVGQADATRDYLFGLTQSDNHQLPDGPLILSPDRLFPSFKREVIDREPFVFKIAALRDIRSLFPDSYNPFYAGFGNRDTDHKAYVHVGVPEQRIFIVDPTGLVHHVNNTYAKSYSSMANMINEMFPKDSDAADDVLDGIEDEDSKLRESKRLDSRFSPSSQTVPRKHQALLEKLRNPVAPSPGIPSERGTIETTAARSTWSERWQPQPNARPRLKNAFRFNFHPAAL